MLEGVQAGDPIIAGAYVDGRGGVCPMLAAHRRGARTSLLSFARAWDRFTRAGRRNRRATGRELAILAGQLQGSLLAESETDLQSAIAEHRKLCSVRAAAQADPIGEIRARRLTIRFPWARAAGRRSAAAGAGGGGETATSTARAATDREPAGAAGS